MGYDDNELIDLAGNSFAAPCVNVAALVTLITFARYLPQSASEVADRRRAVQQALASLINDFATPLSSGGLPGGREVAGAGDGGAGATASSSSSSSSDSDSD